MDQSKFAKVQHLKISEIIPNEWNPNEQEEKIFNELTKDIKEEGFDEPIQVVPLPDDHPARKKGKKWRIIGGEHRWRSVRVLGYEEIPAVIKMYTGEMEQKIKTVRRNQLRGDMNRAKMTKLLNSLKPFGGLTEELARKLGFTNIEMMMRLYQDERGRYTEGMANKVANVKREENAIENLSTILNKLFAEYGDTLQQSYMFFTYGTKLHLMVMMTAPVQKK